ncbi:sugar ABC transporter permease (plasmid) [Ensifer adhaerens]|uniref:carbohydrate ABC transporter permease n=1 Tax=Ensifer adhaerens TaxID=106592 RepID=UPI0023A9BDD2|nr:sugar ABC transporter permease [Ensifer adhaerens]WDZ81833.1 sugar ABC transporter permease [Ensifer adhaerens]
MRREKHIRWLIAPALVLLAAGTLYPVIYSGYLSLLQWNWGSEAKFVGLRNFVRILSGSGFPKALFNTFYFAVFAVVIETFLGLGLALAINRIRIGAGLIRTLMILPLMVSGIAVSLIWKVMLDPTLGIVNYLLSLVGIPGPAWLGTVPTAMPSIIMIDTWWQTAFTFIILSSALKSLPAEPFEAARLEGATPFQTFRFVTLPMLKPVLITVIIFRTIDTLKVFDIIFGTTGGGPLRATESVQTLAYQTAFKSYKFGESAAIAVVFSLIILVLCIIYLVIDTDDGEKA